MYVLDTFQRKEEGVSLVSKRFYSGLLNSLVEVEPRFQLDRTLRESEKAGILKKNLISMSS